MRQTFLIPVCLGVFLFVGCHQVPDVRPKATQHIPSPTPVKNNPTPPLPDASPISPPRIFSKTISGISFEGVSYDSRSHHLRVIDQEGGPGSRYQSSEQLALSTKALLAINAGFFTPEGKPLGLVASNGKTTGGWNAASSLGSGIYLENSSGNTSIRRRSTRSAISGSRELLQAGPLLIERGGAVGGLDSEKSALRSIILTDGASRWWIGKTSSCTLSALASALSQASPAPWKIQFGLNLDGGRSTDLFISSQLSGGPINRRSFLNRPVRNFLILVPR